MTSAARRRPAQRVTLFKYGHKSKLISSIMVRVRNTHPTARDGTDPETACCAGSPQAGNPVLHFSGGKPSACCLDLVFGQRRREKGDEAKRRRTGRRRRMGTTGEGGFLLAHMLFYYFLPRLAHSFILPPSCLQLETRPRQLPREFISPACFR